MEGDGFGALIDDLASALASRGVDREVVADSCRYLLGGPLSPTDLAVLSWRLAGNVDRLKAGLAVTPWSVQRVDEWMPIQVLSCRPARDRRRRRGVYLAFRALAGTGCPVSSEQFWTSEQCWFFATALGFERRRRLGYDGDPRNFVGLRLHGLFTPASCRFGSLRFDGLRVTGALSSHNRELIEVRARASPCPRGHSHLCSSCPVGYTGADRCRYATHPEPWSARPCAGCGRDMPFDLSLSADVCVVCYLRDV